MKKRIIRVVSQGVVAYPDTHLCVNLKVVKRQPGHMIVDDCLEGAIVRDGEEHFTFIQNQPVKKVEVRNPHLFKGVCVNLIKRVDGTLSLHFNHPSFSKDFTFKDFCHEAAVELLLVADLVEKPE